MTHQVLSRKYRPQRFDECVGQEHVARIFQNALLSDRVGHAYLLVGPRGVGKTTTARIVARALNCETLNAGTASEAAAEASAGLEPCGSCASCRDIAAGSDLDVVEMDAASNNAVDDVRALKEQVGYATVRSRYRIWIVDEVHMLSLPAFNAFLKTLEEPPAQVKFLFCTTEEHKLPDTFRSRCQRVEFRPIDAGAMATRLVQLADGEGVVLEEGVARSIADGALGGLRDAESQLEQLIAARAGDEAIGQDDLDALSGRASSALLGRLLEAVDAQDAAAALDAVDACLGAGSKPGVLVDQWLEALRGQMVAAVRAGTGYAKAARSIEVLLGKRGHLRAGADGGLVAQVAAVELARLPDARDLDALIGALKASASAPEALPPPGSSRGPIAAPPRAAPSDAAPSGPLRPPKSPAMGAAAPGDKRADAGSSGAGPSGGGGAAPQAPPVAVRVAQAGAAASARPAVARGPLDLERVQSRWADLTQSGAVRSPVLGRVLGAVRPVALEGTTLLVALPVTEAAEPGGGEARGTLQRREVHLALSQITKAVFGEALRVKIFESEDGPTSMDPIAHELRDHPEVQRIAEVTGGRLLHVQRRAEPEGGSDAV